MARELAHRLLDRVFWARTPQYQPRPPAVEVLSGPLVRDAPCPLDGDDRPRGLIGGGHFGDRPRPATHDYHRVPGIGDDEVSGLAHACRDDELAVSVRLVGVGRGDDAHRVAPGVACPLARSLHHASEPSADDGRAFARYRPADTIRRLACDLRARVGIETHHRNLDTPTHVQRGRPQALKDSTVLSSRLLLTSALFRRPGGRGKGPRGGREAGAGREARLGEGAGIGDTQGRSPHRSRRRCRARRRPRPRRPQEARRRRKPRVRHRRGDAATAPSTSTPRRSASPGRPPNTSKRRKAGR